ncbi:kdo(2)-lipid IV(A) palmitoleoyltransferase, partial [Escherichia coli]|nr:kdo(2)-lipid IV(A) palmitoleoyltransferase [Escherichia coli]
MKRPQKFKSALLHPRYWFPWFGLACFFLLVHLPYPVLHKLGVWMGRPSMRFLNRRVAIPRRNLELCFPNMD